MDTCFFITPIGKPGTASRRRANEMYSRVVRPAAEQAGMAPMRGDKIDRSGKILSQVLREIRKAPVCVADLHGFNPNVMYEIAYAHATRTPVVVLIDPRDVENLPYDIRDQRATVVSFASERSVAEAVASVAKQLAEPPGATPMSEAIDLQRLEDDLPGAIMRIYQGINDILFLQRYQQAGRLGRARKRLKRSYVNRVPKSARRAVQEAWREAYHDAVEMQPDIGTARAGVFCVGEFGGLCAKKALETTSQAFTTLEQHRARARKRHLRLLPAA